MNSEIQQAILGVLVRYNTPIPRAVICEELELPRTTCYDNLRRLWKKKKVKKELEYTEQKGRPTVLWGSGDADE